MKLLDIIPDDTDFN